MLSAFLATISFFVFIYSLGLVKDYIYQIDFMNEYFEYFTDQLISLDDLDFTDIFYSKGLLSENKIDTNIVIINIGRLDRLGIANQLEKINRHKPKVIGINVFFRHLKHREQDTILAERFEKSDNLVFISSYENDDSIHYTHPFFLKDFKTGFANLTPSKDAITRENKIFMNDNNSKEYAFAVQVAMQFDSLKTTRFLGRGNEFETINYAGDLEDFRSYDWNDLECNHGSNSFDEDNLEFLRGKIVLMGFTGKHNGQIEFENSFYTPFNSRERIGMMPDMFGTVIQANLINMILCENYIDHYEEETLWITFFLIMLLLFHVYYYILYGFRNKYDLLSKTIAFILILCTVAIGLCTFYYFRIKIDLFSLIFILAISPDFFEIYICNFQPLFEKFLTRNNSKLP